MNLIALLAGLTVIVLLILIFRAINQLQKDLKTDLSEEDAKVKKGTKEVQAASQNLPPQTKLTKNQKDK